MTRDVMPACSDFDGSPPDHCFREKLSQPVVPETCCSCSDGDGASNEDQPLMLASRPHRRPTCLLVVVWCQWALIVFLAIIASILWADRRAHLTDPGPDTMPPQLPDIQPLVPDDVTAAKEALNYGYYVAEPIPYDILRNVSVLERRLVQLGLGNFSTGVKANGRYGVYIDDEGRRRFLHPKLTINDTEAYLISGLHHMHCMMETLRDYGLLVNGFRPLWNDHHVVHCFNLWYRSIECAADSTAEGYTEPFGTVPAGEIRRASWASSVPRCRDFGALLRWAKDPVRALPFHYDSGLDVMAVSKLYGECDVTECRDEGGWKGLD
ncbi:hypothetical protein CGRA01v4_14157 [Colletotrichum graminicola]|uniref:Tat pathway signal sequence n=1 Tax=Colletotrichum graminicola (strain M1.001 / M2 / FGSC 10212) TaxID=645133 RepID=E3R0T0_COLGM|nr:uncharacterized protein GLRG_11866 [Colletotrichum graminicola M1.001]EFQ36718.1 hypothetical protein GLRG_11866 [Colletotrichum graminicola M1.001]WDK22866.1 hypothetical protein CGRA01v4_14157 [Colletotrichum graminicola]